MRASRGRGGIRHTQSSIKPLVWCSYLIEEPRFAPYMLTPHYSIESNRYVQPVFKDQRKRQRQRQPASTSNRLLRTGSMTASAGISDKWMSIFASRQQAASRGLVATNLINTARASFLPNAIAVTVLGRLAWRRLESKVPCTCSLSVLTLWWLGRPARSE